MSWGLGISASFEVLGLNGQSMTPLHILRPSQHRSPLRYNHTLGLQRTRFLQPPCPITSEARWCFVLTP